MYTSLSLYINFGGTVATILANNRLPSSLLSVEFHNSITFVQIIIPACIAMGQILSDDYDERTSSIWISIE